MLQVDNVEPSLPDASQVLVRVMAASINPVDFKIRNGKYPAVKEDRLPYTLGRDVSGTIEKCGAQATQFKVGDAVFGMVGIGGGGYAEKVVLDQTAMTWQLYVESTQDSTTFALYDSGVLLEGTPASNGQVSQHQGGKPRFSFQKP